jgi:hypothetical protein
MQPIVSHHRSLSLRRSRPSPKMVKSHHVPCESSSGYLCSPQHQTEESSPLSRSSFSSSHFSSNLAVIFASVSLRIAC